MIPAVNNSTSSDPFFSRQEKILIAPALRIASMFLGYRLQLHNALQVFLQSVCLSSEAELLDVTCVAVFNVRTYEINKNRSG